MKIQITPLTYEDIAEVSEIEKECFSVPWTPKNFEETLAMKNAYYYVARVSDFTDGDGNVLENQIVGYCGAYGVLDEGDINQVAVSSKYRNKGIAKMLVGTMIDDLQKNGFENITLEVRKSNEAAIALYESFGFKTEGVRKNFYEKPTEDALIMWKK